MTKRMQGRIGPLLLVAATAALLAGCDLPTGSGDDSVDYAQVCTNAAGDAEPDSDCDTADDDYQGASYVSGRSYMWRYYPASNLTIPAYGSRMPAIGSVRRPSVIVVGTPGGSAGGGSSRPAKIQMPSAGSSGGDVDEDRLVQRDHARRLRCQGWRLVRLGQGRQLGKRRVVNASERRASIEVLLAVAKELGYEAREHSYDDGAHVQLIIAGHDVELGVRFRATATDYLAFYGAVLSVGNSGDRRLFTISAVMRAMREKAARS